MVYMYIYMGIFIGKSSSTNGYFSISMFGVPDGQMVVYTYMKQMTIKYHLGPIWKTGASKLTWLNREIASMGDFPNPSTDCLKHFSSSFFKPQVFCFFGGSSYQGPVQLLILSCTMLHWGCQVWLPAEIWSHEVTSRKKGFIGTSFLRIVELGICWILPRQSMDNVWGIYLHHWVIYTIDCLGCFSLFFASSFKVRDSLSTRLEQASRRLMTGFVDVGGPRLLSRVFWKK